MRKTMLAVLVTVAFSAIGVLGDYFLKLSSARDQPLRTRWFYIGFAVYASTAFGWVFVMRHLKLATISVVYSISMVLSWELGDERSEMGRRSEVRVPSEE